MLTAVHHNSDDFMGIEGVYMVESLLQKRLYFHPDLGKEIVQYKVKWVGFKRSSSTWEPSWNLSSAVISEYEQKTNPRAELPPDIREEEEEEDPDVDEGGLNERAVLRSCSYSLCTNIEISPCQFEACAGCLSSANPDGDGDGGTSKGSSNSDGGTNVKTNVTIVYCSVACQREAWPEHKLVCDSTANVSGDDGSKMEAE